jgi:outer membrane protein TolC
LRIEPARVRVRLAMRTLLGLALVCAGTRAMAASELRIGSASEIDTAALRRAIETTRGDRSPARSADQPMRVLDIEEAMQIALEHNLQLQISALDRDTALREVPARRAFYHPTPGYTFVATDDRVKNPLDFPLTGPPVKIPGSFDFESRFSHAFVRQELPTGAQLSVGVDLLRESGDDFAGGTSYEGGAQISLRQPLMRGGRIYVATAPIRDAEYTVGILESRLRAQILQVIADTKQAYYNTILAERLIQVSEQAIARDHELIEASEALFRAGRASQRDIVSAQIQLSDDLSDLAAREAERDVAQRVLRHVLGLGVKSWAE